MLTAKRLTFVAVAAMRSAPASLIQMSISRIQMTVHIGEGYTLDVTEQVRVYDQVLSGRITA